MTSMKMKPCSVNSDSSRVCLRDVHQGICCCQLLPVENCSCPLSVFDHLSECISCEPYKWVGFSRAYLWVCLVALLWVFCLCITSRCFEQFLEFFPSHEEIRCAIFEVTSFPRMNPDWILYRYQNHIRNDWNILNDINNTSTLTMSALMCLGLWD